MPPPPPLPLSLMHAPSSGAASVRSDSSGPASSSSLSPTDDDTTLPGVSYAYFFYILFCSVHLVVSLVFIPFHCTPPPPTPYSPSFVRQASEDVVQFGDVLLVTLVAARRLVACDWNGFSDPYAQLCFHSGHAQHAKSSMKKATLNPAWNEPFCFWLEPGATTATLSLMLFDHNVLSRDEPIGSVDIDVSHIARDQSEPLSCTYSLVGVATGEVELALQRAVLSSAELKAVVGELVKLKGPLTESVLKKHCVSLATLTGDAPFVRCGHANFTILPSHFPVSPRSFTVL